MAFDEPQDADIADRAEEAYAEEPIPAGALGHLKGTLAIVALYGVLFALGWLALYLFVFVPRGMPHP